MQAIAEVKSAFSSNSPLCCVRSRRVRLYPSAGTLEPSGKGRVVWYCTDCSMLPSMKKKAPQGAEALGRRSWWCCCVCTCLVCMGLWQFICLDNMCAPNMPKHWLLLTAKFILHTLAARPCVLHASFFYYSSWFCPVPISLR